MEEIASRAISHVFGEEGRSFWLVQWYYTSKDALSKYHEQTTTLPADSHKTGTIHCLERHATMNV